MVEEVRENRVHITLPRQGWLSRVAQDGIQILSSLSPQERSLPTPTSQEADSSVSPAFQQRPRQNSRGRYSRVRFDSEVESVHKVQSDTSIPSSYSVPASPASHLQKAVRIAGMVSATAGAGRALSPSFSNLKAGPAWTLQKAIIREAQKTDSAKVAVLQEGQQVVIKTMKGARVEISEPVLGWLSTRTKDNIQILSMLSPEERVRREAESSVATPPIDLSSFEVSPGRSTEPDAEAEISPGLAWTMQKALLREAFASDSAKVTILAQGTQVTVVEMRDARVHISEPQEGWLSSRTAQGLPILSASAPEMEPDTPGSSPVKSTTSASSMPVSPAAHLQTAARTVATAAATIRGLSPSFSDLKPGPAWALQKAIVRNAQKIDSPKVAVLPEGQQVMIKTMKGARVEISEPVSGWLSTRTKENIQILSMLSPEERTARAAAETLLQTPFVKAAEAKSETVQPARAWTLQKTLVRERPAVNSNKVAMLSEGAEVHVKEIVDGYVHITKPKDGWFAVKSLQGLPMFTEIPP